VKSHMRSDTARGFSLIELMIVVTLILVVSGAALVSIQPAMRTARVNNGYNITLAALRQARDLSVGQRQTYFITFTLPNIITITQGGSGTVVNTYTLPSDIGFIAVAGIPTNLNAPDQFGVAGAISFDQGVAGGATNVIYFMPDGSAQDVNGNLNNGVIYIARAGELYSSHAITVWGATGRLRGWRLYSNAGTPYWRQN